MSEPKEEQELQRHVLDSKSNYITVWMASECLMKSVNQTLNVNLF